MICVLGFQFSLRVVFFASIGSLQFLLHKFLWCCLFLSELNHFENSCMHRFQSDLISKGRTENNF